MRLFAVCAAVLVGHSAIALAQPQDAQSSRWDAYVQQFLDDYFAANPDSAVNAGRHEFDGQLPDWSPQGLARESQRIKTERERVLAFKDDQLDQQRRFERDYLMSQLDTARFWLELSDSPYTNPSYYGQSLDPDTYVSREYAPLETRIRSFTKYALNVPRALTQAKANLRLPMAKTLVKIGRRSIGGLADFYEKDVVAVFAPVKDEQLQREFRRANDAAIRAVRDFDAWLAAQEPSANDDFAIGSQKFAQMLKMTERVDTPLDELEAIGRRDLERNQNALKEACAKFAAGKSLAEAMALAISHKPRNPDPVVAASDQLSMLRHFIVDHQLVAIPGTEQAIVRRAPAYKAWNFAYINIPGPYERDLPSIYYVSPPDPTWSKAVQDAYVPSESSLLFTSAHEVYPGHFVQFLHANRSGSKVGQVFVGYAFAEGWAHYCEEMMYDAGLGGGDPEAHIGQLQEALLRNVRFLAAIGMHTRGMTVEQARQMFLKEGFQDEGSSQQQAERGTFDPGYLNYTMGKLMIRKLRDDWTATRGGRAAWKQFHDEFLKFGGPPIPMIRRAMMGSDDMGSLF
jgi:uncharacterized protein (DUF885 family)